MINDVNASLLIDHHERVSHSSGTSALRTELQTSGSTDTFATDSKTVNPLSTQSVPSSLAEQCHREIEAQSAYQLPTAIILFSLHLGNGTSG